MPEIFTLKEGKAQSWTGIIPHAHKLAKAMYASSYFHLTRATL